MRPLAYQLYSVREACASDLGATLSHLRGLGYGGVEFAGLHGHTAREVGHRLVTIGLRATSMHHAIEQIEAEPDDVEAMARTLGTDLVVSGWTTARTEADVEAYARGLERCVRLMTERGVRMAHHNHDFEFLVRVGGRTMFERLLAIEGLWIELDLGWAWYAHEDPLRWVRSLGHRLAAVHVKDFVGRPDAAGGAAAMPDRERFCAVGAGAVGFGGMLASIAAMTPAPLILEQDESVHRSSLEDAARSIDFACGALSRSSSGV